MNGPVGCGGGVHSSASAELPWDGGPPWGTRT